MKKSIAKLNPTNIANIATAKFANEERFFLATNAKTAEKTTIAAYLGYKDVAFPVWKL